MCKGVILWCIKTVTGYLTQLIVDVIVPFGHSCRFLESTCSPTEFTCPDGTCAVNLTGCAVMTTEPTNMPWNKLTTPSTMMHGVMTSEPMSMKTTKTPGTVHKKGGKARSQRPLKTQHNPISIILHYLYIISNGCPNGYGNCPWVDFCLKSW